MVTTICEDDACAAIKVTMGTLGLIDADACAACACTPSCDGAVCGDDGCGGVCGFCGDGQECVAGACEGGPEPTCQDLINECTTDLPLNADLACGILAGEPGCLDVMLDGYADNGCGSACGALPDYAILSICYDDACAATKGTLSAAGLVTDEVCGACGGDCTPSCGDNVCGGDGCGGSCGTCDGELECVDGACMEVVGPTCAALLSECAPELPVDPSIACGLLESDTACMAVLLDAYDANACGTACGLLPDYAVDAVCNNDACAATWGTLSGLGLVDEALCLECEGDPVDPTCGDLLDQCAPDLPVPSSVACGILEGDAPCMALMLDAFAANGCGEPCGLLPDYAVDAVCHESACAATWETLAGLGLVDDALCTECPSEPVDPTCSEMLGECAAGIPIEPEVACGILETDTACMAVLLEGYAANGCGTACGLLPDYAVDAVCNDDACAATWATLSGLGLVDEALCLECDAEPTCEASISECDLALPIDDATACSLIEAEPACYDAMVQSLAANGCGEVCGLLTTSLSGPLCDPAVCPATYAAVAGLGLVDEVYCDACGWAAPPTTCEDVIGECLGDPGLASLACGVLGAECSAVIIGAYDSAGCGAVCADLPSTLIVPMCNEPACAAALQAFAGIGLVDPVPVCEACASSSLMCQDVGVPADTCTNDDGSDCECVGCTDDGQCSLDDDCVCDGCASDSFCGNPTNCTDDGVCSPWLEGCICADCVGHPTCLSCEPTCGDNVCGPDGCGGSCGTCGAGSYCVDGGCQQAGELVCDDINAFADACLDDDGADCECAGCVIDGGCGLDDDCVCGECANDSFCSDPSNCQDDGICSPYVEGCQCNDCLAHPECAAP